MCENQKKEERKRERSKRRKVKGRIRKEKKSNLVIKHTYLSIQKYGKKGMKKKRSKTY